MIWNLNLGGGDKYLIICIFCLTSKLIKISLFFLWQKGSYKQIITIFYSICDFCAEKIPILQKHIRQKHMFFDKITLLEDEKYLKNEKKNNI